MLIARGVQAGKSYAALQVSASNASAAEEGPAASGRVPAINHRSTVVTISGGLPPYTYSWTKLSDADGTDFIIDDATSQDAGWYGNRNDADFDNIEGWRITVTDDDNNIETDDIDVTLTWLQNPE